MNNVWTKTAQDPPQTHIDTPIMPFSLVKRDHRHFGPMEALLEVGGFG
jgi:hypothetical protein